MKAKTKSGHDIEQLSLITFRDGRQIYMGLMTDKSSRKQSICNWDKAGYYSALSQGTLDIDLDSIEQEPDLLDEFMDFIEHFQERDSLRIKSYIEKFREGLK